MIYFSKRTPLWLMLLSAVFSVGGLWMFAFNDFSKTTFYFMIKPLVVPPFLIQLLMLCFGLLFLFLFVDGLLYSDKRKLTVSREGISVQCDSPSWWPLFKTVSLKWNEIDEVLVGKAKGSLSVVFKSKKGKITISNQHFEKFDEIMKEVGAHVKVSS